MVSSFRVNRINAKPASPDEDLEERVATQPASPMDELQRKRVSNILEIIKSGRPCKVCDLACEFNLSKSHLQHLFKQETGLCLGRLLIEQKLQIAAHLLKSSRMRIKQIACAVGYGHTSSFTRAFERRFAEPPQLYRCHCKPGPSRDEPVGKLPTPIHHDA
jgi:transcriptional regulator GlxA family with amidase domain